MVSGIIQRWGLTLATYSYTFRYVLDTKIPHADALSRLPSKSIIHEIPPIPQVIFCITNFEEKISVKEIRKEVALDQVFQMVMKYTNKVWPEKNTLHRNSIRFYRKRL